MSVGGDQNNKAPKHWKVVPLRFLSKIRKGRIPAELSSSPMAESDLPYLSMEYLRGESVDPDYAPALNAVRAEHGDILILWDGSNAGEFIRAKCGAVSSTAALIEPKFLDKNFLYFSCKALERHIRDQTIGMGIPHVSAEDLKSCLIAFPDIAEQVHIAGFLERETRSIDSLIAELRLLLQLLKEKRQSIISHAVTRGLNLRSVMKDSGSSWLGSIPSHWTTARMRHACSSIFLGLTSKVDYVEEGGIPLVRALNISGGILDLSDARSISVRQHRNLTKRNLAQRGDVLLSKSGSIGTVAIVDCDDEFSIYESIFALRAMKQKLLPKYLLYLLRSSSCYAQYAASSVGMGVGHLNMSDIVDVQIALPPLEEQALIVDYLENETSKLDGLDGEVRRAVDLLQERRTALISAAVSGQIDVNAFTDREAA